MNFKVLQISSPPAIALSPARLIKRLETMNLFLFSDTEKVSTCFQLKTALHARFFCCLYLASEQILGEGGEMSRIRSDWGVKLLISLLKIYILFFEFLMVKVFFLFPSLPRGRIGASHCFAIDM